MKKLLSVLLATAMLLSLLSVSSVGLSVAADSTEYNWDYDWDSSLWYYVTGDNEVVITQTDSSAIVIPETIEGLPVVGISPPHYTSLYVTEITIPASIKWIEAGAFGHVEQLQKVHVLDLAAWCQIDFAGSDANPLSCENAELYVNGEPVEELVIPEGVESIKQYAFFGADSITSVVIPEGVTHIGQYAFNVGLKNLTVPTTLKKVDTRFYAENVYVEDLGAWCEIDFGGYDSPLNGAKALYVNGYKTSYLRIPSGTKSINAYAFYGYEGFTSVEIPSSVTYIDRCAFLDCPNLESFYVWADNPNYKSSQNILFSKDGTQLLTYPPAIPSTAYTIPSTVTKIGDGAFRVCKYLKNVTIGDTVTHIGMTSFYNCKALESVSIGTGLSFVDQYAFYTIPTLNKVEIKDLTAWLNVDFYWEDSSPLVNGAALYVNSQPVVDLVIPDGIKTICDYAFEGCASIKTVKIPAGVETVGVAAFYKCSNLESVWMAEGVKTLLGSAFNKCANLKSVVLPHTIEKIGNRFCNASPDIWYTGTKEERDAIEIESYGNTPLLNTTWHYNACPVGGDHSYDHDGDTGCNNCGFTRKVVDIAPHATTIAAKKGETAELALDVMGKNLTYTWYYKNKGDSKFAVTKTFTDNRYFVEMNAARSGRQIYCVVADPYGNTVTSDVVTLGLAATITKESATGCYAKRNAVAKATVTAEGDGLTYQWFVKNPGATEYVKSSLTTATYSAKMTATNSGRLIHCIVTDAYGNQVKSKTFVMRMQATIVTQPKSATVKNGATAKTTVKAAGDGLTYTWYIKNKGAKSFTKSSIKSATYSVKMSTKVNGRQVYCVVKDKYGKSVKSSTVTLKKK